MQSPETINDFLVGAIGDEVIVLSPVHGRMTKAQALRMAAWLIVIADPLEEEFPAVYQAVRST